MFVPTISRCSELFIEPVLSRRDNHDRDGTPTQRPPLAFGISDMEGILDLPPAEPEFIDKPIDTRNIKQPHRTPSPLHPVSAMNPYAAGGWGSRSGMAPSIFGALPTTTIANAGSMQRDSVLYKFTKCSTTILNCTIAGPNGRAVYRVATESGAPSSTMFKDNDNRNVAMVNWQPNASVEIRGIASRQPVRDWLRLSTDQRFGPSSGCNSCLCVG